MKRLWLFFAIAILSLTSCGISMKWYYPTFSSELVSVESPVDAKEQFGETKIITINEDGLTKYHYEDDWIDIIWYVTDKEFDFSLKNKSKHTLKINWDDISLVDIDGNVKRVMHSGVKYNNRNESQPATNIPRNATLTDNLTPTNNIGYIDGLGWKTTNLIPLKRQSTREDLAKYIKDYNSKDLTMSIMLPIEIESVQNDYVFVFAVTIK